MKRRWLWFLLLAAALLFSFAAIWVAWNLVSKARVDRTVAELRRAGYPASVADIHREPLPPEEDAGPILRQVFSLLEEGSGSDVLARLDEDEGYPLDPSPRSIEALREIDEVFAKLHEAADRPRCDFQARYDLVYWAPMTWVYWSGRAGNLLVARAAARARDGRLAEAQADLRVVARLAEFLAAESSLLAHVTRMELLEASLDALEWLLPDRPDAIGVFPAALRPRPTASGLRGELVLIAELASRPELWERLPLPGPRIAVRAIGPYVRVDLVFMMETTRALIVASELPYPEAFRKAASLTSGLREETGPVSGCLDLGAEECLQQEAALASRLVMARIAAAAFRFREREGRLPEGVAKLGEIGREVDPVTGETFMLAGEPGERAIASRGPDPQTGEELRWRLELPEGEEGDGENR